MKQKELARIANRIDLLKEWIKLEESELSRSKKVLREFAPEYLRRMNDDDKEIRLGYQEMLRHERANTLESEAKLKTFRKELADKNEEHHELLHE